MERVVAIVTYQTGPDLKAEKLRRRYFKSKKAASEFVQRLLKKGNVIFHVVYPASMVAFSPDIFKEEEVIRGRFYEIY